MMPDPRLHRGFDARALPRGAARAFDRGKTLFSESLTTVNINAYLAVQRILYSRTAVSARTYPF